MDDTGGGFLDTGVRFLHTYFDLAAADYADAIEPAFAPLVDGLVEFAADLDAAPLADLGSGTGLVSRALMRLGISAVAVDISRPMLAGSRREGVQALIQGDLHRLPFQDAAFGLALASFAFNSTDPRVSFPEVCRVVRPAGRLVLQEWGEADALGELVSDTLAAYALDEPPEPLRLLREATEQPVPWDELETVEDIEDAVASSGFAVERFEVAAAEVRMASLDAFLRYKLGWPSRRAELEAMPPDVRRLMLNDLHENLSPHLSADGSLLWRPGLIRISARRPA